MATGPGPVRLAQAYRVAQALTSSTPADIVLVSALQRAMSA
jgi:hypothetical protein